MSQRKRREYRPVVGDELESRLVLSNAGGRLPSVLVSGLTPGLRSVGRTRHPPITALVNQAFDSFVQDFTQARSTYLSSRPDPSSVMSVTNAFKIYTRYRVSLLGQQLISSGLQSTARPSKNSKGPGLTLPLVINRRIINLKDGAMPAGTLARDLSESTPQVGGTSGAIALASLAQDQAIEAARVSVLNGFAVIKNGNGGTKTKL